MTVLIDTLQILTEPRRRQILQLIWSNELSVGAIADEVDVSSAAVSQHLSKLKKIGAVTVRADGKRRLYTADREALARLAPMLELMWSADVDQLAARAEEEHRRL